MAGIEGTVTDPQGNPLGNVRVTVTPNGGGDVVAETTTNDSGFYDVTVSADVYDISIATAGYYDTEKSGVSVTAGNTTVVDFTMDGAYRVRGRIDDGRNDSTGVLGTAVDTTGRTYGVTGLTDTAAQQFDAAGVYGEATDPAGSASGVRGLTRAGGDFNAGFRFPTAGLKGVGDADSGPTNGVYGVVNDATDGNAGVEGLANVGSGEIYGVRGSTVSEEGYGLYTPDDVKYDGDLEATNGHRLTVDGDRGFRLGPSGTDTNASGVTYTVGGSVVGGYRDNTTNGALGATIAGGGAERTDDEFGRLLTAPNEVTDRYGTVGGGAANQAGDAKSGTTNAEYATVAGGFNNLAGTDGSGSTTGAYATVGGGNKNTATGDSATVGGGDRNTASADNATIGGGSVNIVSGLESTVGGGRRNIASIRHATVGGGLQNIASDVYTTVAGGVGNTASDTEATVGGGGGNEAIGRDSTIGGGNTNRTGATGTAKGYAATVPGGEDNVALEDYSFAAGRLAQAEAEGAFVWGDSSSGNVKSTVSNEFKVQAGGGAVIYSKSDLSAGVALGEGDTSWGSTSTREVKTDLEPVDPNSVLSEVEQLPITTWTPEGAPDIRHMGPMAEDFHDAFGLGIDEKHINTVDADGVAFAAIQGLSDRLDEKDERIEEQQHRIESQRDRIDDLAATVEELQTENEIKDDRIDDLTATVEEREDRIDDLEARLAALEATVTPDGDATTEVGGD